MTCRDEPVSISQCPSARSPGAREPGSQEAEEPKTKNQDTPGKKIVELHLKTCIEW